MTDNLSYLDPYPTDAPDGTDAVDDSDIEFVAGNPGVLCLSVAVVIDRHGKLWRVDPDSGTYRPLVKAG